MNLQEKGPGWELWVDQDTLILYRQMAEVADMLTSIPKIEERASIPGLGNMLQFIEGLYQKTWLKRLHISSYGDLASLDGILHDIVLALENRAFLGSLIVHAVLGVKVDSDTTWEGVDEALTYSGFAPCKKLVREIVLSKDLERVNALRAAMRLSRPHATSPAL